MLRQEPLQAILGGLRKLLAQSFARIINCLWVWCVPLGFEVRGDVHRGRQRAGQCAKRGRAVFAAQAQAPRIYVSIGRGFDAARHVTKSIQRQGPACFPRAECIAVMGHQTKQVILALICVQNDWRGKTTVERKGGGVGRVAVLLVAGGCVGVPPSRCGGAGIDRPALCGIVQHQDTGRRQVATICINQPDC